MGAITTCPARIFSSGRMLIRPKLSSHESARRAYHPIFPRKVFASSNEPDSATFPSLAVDALRLYEASLSWTWISPKIRTRRVTEHLLDLVPVAFDLLSAARNGSLLEMIANLLRRHLSLGNHDLIHRSTLSSNA